MVQLLTDMWMGLAGAGLIGLILGWAFRGAFLPRPKTVNVAPKIAETFPAELTVEQKQALLRAEQADAAVAALEARVKAAQEAAAGYQGELNEAKATLEGLRVQLNEARATADHSAAPVAETVAAGLVDAVAEEAAAPEKAPAPADETEETFSNDPRLEWRNRFLESRVRHLESQLADAGAPAPAPVPAAEPVVVAADTSAFETEITTLRGQLGEAEQKLAGFAGLEGEISRLKSAQEAAEARIEAALRERDELQTRLEEANNSDTVVAGVAGAALGGAAALAGSALMSGSEEAEAAPIEAAAEPGIDPTEFAKLKWQNKYLKARALYLEENMADSDMSAPTAEPVEAVEDTHEVDTLKSELTVLRAELSRVTQADNEAEKELTGLRWRNRYLEGRLKYLEAASLDAASEADDPKDEVAAALEQITRSVESKEPEELVIAQDTVAPVIAPPVVVEDIAEEPVETPSADAEAADEIRPPSLDAPVGGEPDDLKRIGGIGPKIEGILNELGIFHFDQLASWSEAEAGWVDSYLRFQGRVQREKWVDQAVSLAKAKANALG